MKQETLISLVLLAILVMVLPFMVVGRYGAPLTERVNQISVGVYQVKSDYATIGISEVFFIPLSVWYLMYFIVMLFMKRKENGESVRRDEEKATSDGRDSNL